MTDRKTTTRLSVREIADRRWHAEKHLRILQLVSRAQKLGFQTHLITEVDDPGNVRVIIDGTEEEELFGWRTFFVKSMPESSMILIENAMKVVEDDRELKLIRQRKRQDILDRLTAEERELLGV